MPDPYTDPPRPASSPESNAARTGLVVLIMTPLVAYRIVPLFMSLVGVPPDNQPGYGELLIPAMTGGIVGALAWIGTTLRDLAYAKGGNVANIVGKMLPVALLMVLIGGCASTPAQKELAALRLTGSMQTFAHLELTRHCPTEAISVDPALAIECRMLADQNVAWQTSLQAADYAYQAAQRGGNKADIDLALMAANTAACEIAGLFPQAATKADPMPEGCPEWIEAVIVQPAENCLEVK